MNRISAWLHKEPKTSDEYWFLWRNSTIIIMLWYLLAGQWLFRLMGPNESIRELRARDFQETIAQPFFDAVLSILYYAAIEEIFFRVAPLFLAVLVYQWMKHRHEGLLLGTCLAVSVLFGWVHGGFEYVPAQGVGGFVWSLLYLKCGGIRLSVIKAFTFTTTCHFSWNMMIYAPKMIMTSLSI